MIDWWLIELIYELIEWIDDDDNNNEMCTFVDREDQNNPDGSGLWRD